MITKHEHRKPTLAEIVVGQDGMFGTADDIRSWGEPEPPPDPRASA